jgi:hypothetical protein
MSATVLNPSEPSGAPPDWAPLLRWLVFTGFTIFAALLLWRYGLLRLMLQSDRTYISSIISSLYVGASLHCLYRTIAISREGERERRTAQVLARGGGEAVFAAEALPEGLTADHIRDLGEKALTQGARRLDQTLLLRGLADRLRGSNGFGNFASDSLMKLGLLGTIIGFIIMLAPIAGLDVSDKSVLKSSMGVMSDGMAVAMYTTLAGLVGSILLKLQYYMLESATSGLFARVVRLTETRVVPALERRYDR